MGIDISQKPEQNVVNVGDEISSAQLAAIQNATGASGTNPLVTLSESQRNVARRLVQTSLTTLGTQTNGTGAAYTQVQLYSNANPPNAGIAGFSRAYYLARQPIAGGLIDWSKPIGFTSWCGLNNGTIYSGHTFRCGLGFSSSPTAGVVVGDLAERGFYFYWTQGGQLLLRVHDGTTLRSVNTGYTPTTTTPIIALEAFSDGAGNVNAKVTTCSTTSGSIPVVYTCSSSNGPTGANSTASSNGYMIQMDTSTTHTAALSFSGLHPTLFYI